MTNLRVVFKITILFILTSSIAYGQGDEFIDSNYLRVRLINYYNTHYPKYFEQNRNDSDKILIQNKFSGLSSIYKFYEVGTRWEHTPTLFYVWNSREKLFVDSVTINDFNSLVSALNIKLDNCEKALLYNRLVLQKNPIIYETLCKVKFGVQHCKQLYEVKHEIFSENAVVYYRPELHKNKDLLLFMKSQNKYIFILPHFSKQDIKTSNEADMESVTFQMFYFNEKGDLTATTYLHNLIDVKRW